MAPVVVGKAVALMSELKQAVATSNPDRMASAEAAVRQYADHRVDRAYEREKFRESMYEAEPQLYDTPAARAKMRDQILRGLLGH